MTPKILLPRYFKWLGLALYVLSIAYTILNMDNIKNLNDVRNINGYLVQISVFIGLFLMISAKLRIEDEWSSYIRMISFPWALVLFISYQLFFMSLAFYYEDKSYFPKGAINLLLLIYLIIFYAQVRFIPWLKEIFTNHDK